MRFTSTTGGIVFAVAVVAALSGCSGTSTTSEPTVTRTVTASASASPSVSSTAPAGASAGSTASSTPSATPTCGTSDAASAAAAAVADLPAPAGIEGATWDAANAEVSGYDPCASLSWILVGVERGSGSSPVAVLLFHEGRYLGTATKEQYAFFPDVSRTSDSAIAVTYHYAKAGEPNASASGRTEATYTWDADADRVVMTGDTPPQG